MTVPYFLRLGCLCLAAFFLVHLAAGLAVARLTPFAIRLAGRMRAARACRWLLFWRLLPPMAAMVAVAGFCAPSYLWLEPRATAEEVGWGCLLAAALGAATCAVALVRAMRAVWSLDRYQRQWRSTAREVRIAGDLSPVLVLDEATPFLALAGIFRPRLVATRSVLDSLAPEELLTAMRHERAHQASRDNLKRLLLLLAPGLLPGWHGLLELERAWARFAEWAADDRAVGGDPRSSVSLAAALVRVARLGSGPAASALMTSLLADPSDLSARVDRLLEARPVTNAGTWLAVSGPLVAALTAAGLMLLIRQPAALYWVHGTLERLVH
jgi:Zn-dependent protease with chaperone function